MEVGSMLAYEDLKGSSGREIWFRAPRYEARKLFPHLPPRVRVRASLHKLHDISLGGIAVVCNQVSEDLPDVGEIIPLTLQQSSTRFSARRSHSASSMVLSNSTSCCRAMCRRRLRCNRPCSPAKQASWCRGNIA